MWPFSQPTTAEGQAQGAFDHPKVHRELNGGMGVSSLSVAAGDLSGQFTNRLRRVDELVQGALDRCQGSWGGSASEAMRQESSPFRNVVRQSEELSAALAKGVETQGEHFSRTKNTMPAPHNVPSLDLGFSDIVPSNLGMKLAGQQMHEAKHNEAEQKAREDYAAYRSSSNATVQSMKPYPMVPSSVADFGVAHTQAPPAIHAETGYAGTSDTSSSVPSTYRTSDDYAAPAGGGPVGGVPTGDQGDLGQAVSPQPPSGSDSAWATPTGPGQSVTPPGASPGVGQTPDRGGVASLPDAAGTPGRGGGGGANSRTGGRSSSVRGGANVGGGSSTRGGTGLGGRSGLGPGGSSGVGGASGAGASGTSASGTRSGSGPSGIGGAAGAGQRGQNDEDNEHERKFVQDTDEYFEFDGEVDPNTGHLVAPAVLGEGGPDAQQQDNDEDEK